MAGPVPAILAPAGETQMAEADFDRPDHNESSRESASWTIDISRCAAH
jgi:hypothetical protein